MARKRFVTSEISTDRKIAELAEENPIAAALWPWFVTGFDDWGKMSADPIEVKLTIFPAFPYTSSEIKEIMLLYHKYKIAYYYEVDDKPYLAVNPNNWYKYQTYIRQEKLSKQKSKFPDPEDAPWIAKDKATSEIATETVAKQQLATETVLSPSPSIVVSKDTTKDADSERHENKNEDDVSSKELIASLTAYYQDVTGSTDKKDYPFIGGLYNRYGYDAVWAAIDDLKIRLSATPIDQPRSYLIGILRSPNTGPKKNSTNKQPETSYPYQYINTG